LDLDGRESCRRELEAKRTGDRKAGALDLGHRREEAGEPDVVEAVRILGRDREPASGPEDSSRLFEGAGTVDEVEHHPHHDRVEPACLERERLGPRDPRIYAELLGAGHHRLRSVDRPDTREIALLERLGEPPGAASDLEHALTAEPSEPDESLVDLPPVLVDRSQLLVPGGAAVEAGGHASAPRRSGFAPALTSSGSPRSGNGTSIVSKSRGSTVASNTSRASSSSSGP